MELSRKMTQTPMAATAPSADPHAPFQSTADQTSNHGAMGRTANHSLGVSSLSPRQRNGSLVNLGALE